MLLNASRTRLLEACKSAAMTIKIFMLASLFVLAGQVQGKALQGNEEVAPDYGLGEVKKIAVKTITRYHSQVAEAGEVYLNKMKKYGEDIEKDEEMSKFVEERSEHHVKTVNERALELTEKKRQEDKPLDYYLCVEKNRILAQLELTMLQWGYKDVMQKVQERSTNKAKKTLLALQNMNGTFDGLLQHYTNEINACQGNKCVEDAVGEAWKVFKLSKKIMRGFAVSFMKEYQIFFRETYSNAENVISKMDAVVSRILSEMSEC